VKYAGAQPQKLIADGRPANGEDLLVHYALGVPYQGQHGDDLERWVQAYGAFPADPGPGLGMADPPHASQQSEHDWALALADRTMAKAEQRGLRVAVSIVDERGDPIQQDRMDGAPAAAVQVSEATAAAAATFQCPSQDLAARYPSEGVLALLAGALPYRILAAPGALPIEQDGRVVAALGVGGPAPEMCAEIAAAVVGAA
jgi:uncharacterized protein GlcG (DUF336 family)